MPFCTECGEEISDRQTTRFYGLCPECVRISRMETINPYDNQEELPRIPSKLKDNPCIIVIIVILLLMVLPMIVFTFFVFR